MIGGPQVAGPREKVRADVGTPRQTIEAGEPALVDIEITNVDRVIRSYRMRVLGVDPDLVLLEPEVVDLFPGERATVSVMVALPEDHPAGPRTLAVEILEPRVDAPSPAVAEFVVDLKGQPGLTITTEPSTLEIGASGDFLIHAVNTGNVPLTLDLEAKDPERLVEVAFDPPRPTVAPGERTIVRGGVRGPRPWFGMPVVRVLDVAAGAEGVEARSAVAVMHRPRMSRRLISFLGLLLVVTLFAFVIMESFERVADLNAENERLVTQGLGLDQDSSARAQRAALTGSVLAATGAPIDGAAVELFDESNLLRPVKSTVTDANGTFAFTEVDDGSYLARTEAAGYGQVWYPEALTPEDADVIVVEDGKGAGALAFELEGQQGGLSGTVIGADVAGATVVVRLPLDAVVGSELGPVAAVVAGVQTDETGVFEVTGLATPATYELVVSKEGFASDVSTYTLDAGQTQSRIEVILRRGVGVIAGTVVDGAGTPIPGVAIEANDGKTVVTTRSLSGATTTGTFSLRDLSTPGSYTVTFTAPGYFPETLNIALDENQQRGDERVVMTSSTGSMRGRVTQRCPTGGTATCDPSAPPGLGGITVTVSGPDLERTTRTLSVGASGAVGSWLIEDLPLPGTYTVTFAGQGWVTRSRSIDLEPGAVANRVGVDAALTRATASLGGRVTDSSFPPRGIGGVEITLERAGFQRRTVSSNGEASAGTDRAGLYAFDDVPPGVYTVTFERVGSAPQTRLVELAAGDARTENVQLERQASVGGIVFRDGQPTGGVLVVVYRMQDYPDSGAVVRQATTTPDGRFSFVGLVAPESYVIDFHGPSGGPVVASQSVYLQPGESMDLCQDVSEERTSARDGGNCTAVPS